MSRSTPTRAFVEGVADKFLAAVQNAGEIYSF